MKNQQEKLRDVGFVLGQTDWSQMTDPTFAESALTQTKYIWCAFEDTRSFFPYFVSVWMSVE